LAGGGFGSGRSAVLSGRGEKRKPRDGLSAARGCEIARYGCSGAGGAGASLGADTDAGASAASLCLSAYARNDLA